MIPRTLTVFAVVGAICTAGGTGCGVTDPPQTQGDADSDGVLDAIDNCPNSANTSQADSDDDGIGDVCDDSDADGFEDAIDNCLSLPNANQLDTDNDGVGDDCEDLQLSGKAVLITKDNADLLTMVSPNRLRIRFTQPPRDIASDDILVGGITGTGQGHIAKRAKSISAAADNVLEIEIEDATLDDALDDAHLVGSAPLLIDGLNPVAKEGIRSQLIVGGTWDISGELYDDGMLSVSLSNGVAHLGGNIDWEMDYHIIRGLVHFSVTANVDSSIDLDARVEVGAAGTWNREVELLRFPPQFFLIGLVAGQINVVLEAGIEASAAASGAVQTGFDIEASTQLVGEYQDNDWNTRFTPPAPSYNSHPLTWDASATVGARVFVRPRVEMLFYSLAGPALDLESYVSLNGDIDLCEYEAALSAGLTSHVEIDLGALSRTVPRLPSAELFDVHKELRRFSGATVGACCGNGDCEEGESCSNCPDDCACPPSRGACCFGTSCEDDYRSAECSSSGGIYKGNGSDCSEEPCPMQDVGACCISGTCSTSYTQANCQSQGGTWQGANTTTCQNCIPMGACCISGNCSTGYTQANCQSQGGTWQGANTTTCQNCIPMGACCISGNCSTGHTQANCQSQGGTWQGANTTTCQNCIPMGACCISGNCSTGYTQANCQSQGGTWQGANTTTCQNCTVTGACCFGNGACSQLPLTQCDSQNGCYGGDGTVCSSNPCTNLDANPACAAWTSLGSIRGDVGSDETGDSNEGEQWYLVQLTEESLDLPVYLSARIVLRPEVDTDYDLLVYCYECGGELTGAGLTSGGVEEVVDVRWDDIPGLRNDDYVLIEVRWSSGCGGFELDVYGNGFVGAATCH